MSHYLEHFEQHRHHRPLHATSDFVYPSTSDSNASPPVYSENSENKDLQQNTLTVPDQHAYVPSTICTQQQPMSRAPSPQPPHQPPPVVVINQITAQERPGIGYGPTGRPLTGYQVGLCECCYSFSNLLLCCFCPCYISCQITDKLGENSCYPQCFGYLPLNTRFRTLVGIRETMCGEGCTFLWCPCLAVLRLANEMEARSFDLRFEILRA